MPLDAGFILKVLIILIITHMSNGHSEVIAEFDSPKLAKDAYDEVFSSIRRGEKLIQISDYETILRENNNIRDDASNIWTANRFIKELISGEKHEKTYISKGQIKRLSELGADLMNFIDKKQWKLRHKFNKVYFAFYVGSKPYFGVDLQTFAPRLCIWLPAEIIRDRENNGETDSRHERYYNWFNSIGYAAYPTSIEVADIKRMLIFTYKSQRGEKE